MKFFLPPFTKENIESQYKQLAKILHPDSGGSEEDFKDLSREKILALRIAEIQTIPEQKEFKKVSRVKMIPRKKSRGSNTNITFVIDPEKVIELLKQIKKIVK